MITASYGTQVPDLFITPGMRIMAARREAGMTQAEFAKNLGMSTRTLIRWEQSRKAVPPILLAAVSVLTNVNLGWLQTGVANLSDGSLDDTEAEMAAALVRPEGFEPPTFWFGLSGYTLAA